jgi:hypothetical protein
MKRIFQNLFPLKNLDALITSAIGFYAIYLYTQHSGIGISPDSVAYLSTARNIHLYHSITEFSGKPLADFPAFYPIFLSLFIFITRLDPLVFAPLLNGLLFAAVIYTCGWIMEGFNFRSKWYKYIILSCMVISPCLLEIYSMLWSETLFIFFTLLFIISFFYYLQTYTVKRLLTVACIVSLACVTRYAGITLIGTGGLILLLDKELRPGKKFIHIVLFGLIGSALLVINLIRNALLSGTLSGNREKSLTSLTANIHHLGHVFCYWLPLPKDNDGIALAVGFIVTVFFIALFIYRVFNQATYHSYENIAIAFFCVYAIFMLMSATLSRYETFSSRLLSPLFIPFLWGSSCLLPFFTKPFFSNKPLLIVFIVLLITFSFQANQLMNDSDNYEGVGDAGMPGYAEDSWNKDSEIVNFLRSHKGIFKPDYALCSNANDAVYFYTGLRCENLPHIIIQQQLKNFGGYKKIYLVWFNDIDNPELLNLKTTLTCKKMYPLYQLSNGTIYTTDSTTNSKH